MSQEIQTSFSRICQAVLGRPQLRGNCPWKSSSSSFIQIFSDFQKMNIPWWKLGKMAGIFFFYDHLLINFELLSQSTSQDQETLENKVNEDNFTKMQVPDYLQQLFLDNIHIKTDDWNLYCVKDALDSDKLIELLHKMKCPSITSFKGETIEKKPLPMLDYNYFEQANYPPDDDLFQRTKEFNQNPGLFYQSLIPAERFNAVTSKCWLFTTPEDLS